MDLDDAVAVLWKNKIYAESGMGWLSEAPGGKAERIPSHGADGASHPPAGSASSNPLSRWRQKRAIRRMYMTGQAAGETARSAAQAGGAVARAKRGVKAWSRAAGKRIFWRVRWWLSSPL